MDRRKFYKAGESNTFRLLKTSDRTGIFEKNKNQNITLFEPPEAGRPLRGTVENGKDFITTAVQTLEKTGNKYEIETANATYTIVSR